MQGIPVTILSGFLGSGKTTLLNRLLHEDHGVRFAVIVNEFGAIGLDASLLAGTSDFVEMTNGCLCCALNEDLVALLHKLRQRSGIDAVILETTGIADPLPVAWAFLKEEMAGAFRFAGIVTVVDVLHVATMMTQAREVGLQIERADFAWLAKTDICTQLQKNVALAIIRKLNANSRVVDGCDASALRLVFDVERDDLRPPPPEQSQESAQHGATYHSVALDLTDLQLDLNLMEDFFETLPQEVFRAKALFTDTQNRVRVMHAVCGRVDFSDAVGTSPVRAAVFIGRGMDTEKIRQEIQKIAAAC